MHRTRKAPAAVVHRSARIRLRLSSAQARRCFGLLRSAGDVWAALIDMNAVRFRRGGRPVFDYPSLCRELAGADLGELSVTAARSVLRRYSDACFTTAARKGAGERARYPRRRRALMPVRWYAGTFGLHGRALRLSVARHAPPLVVRLAREAPYAPESVRSVTLVADAGRLWVDVTAEVPVANNDLDPERVAGVDPGIIHPYALAGPEGKALLVSGRAMRAEERLHLDDTKARHKKMGRKAPRRGQRGSRRWRQLRAAQARAEARHLRRIRQAHHRADKADLAGIRVIKVDERGTSSTCPRCGIRTKPAGRKFSCPACGLVGHRDLVGAANIAARGGGTTAEPSVVTHRRAGEVPARRDHRRAQFDARRSCPAPGRPSGSGGSRSSVAHPVTPQVAGVGQVPNQEDGRRGSDNGGQRCLKGH